MKRISIEEYTESIETVNGMLTALCCASAGNLYTKIDGHYVQLTVEANDNIKGLHLRPFDTEGDRVVDYGNLHIILITES